MAPTAQGIPLTAAGPFAAANGALPTGGGATLHAQQFAAAAAAAAAAQQQQHQHQQQQQQVLGTNAAAFHLAAAQAPTALKSSTLSTSSLNHGSVVSLPSAVAHQTSTAVSSSNFGTPGVAGVPGNSASAGGAGTIGNSNSAISNASHGKVAGSPAAKKFRPAFARPSHKGSRYIPKPIPQELGNLKTYSKPISYDSLQCNTDQDLNSRLHRLFDQKINCK